METVPVVRHTDARIVYLLSMISRITITRNRTACTRLVVLASLGTSSAFLKHLSGLVVLFVPSKDIGSVITKVVLYYRGQCSSANATVGVGVGREVTIGLRYRL